MFDDEPPQAPFNSIPPNAGVVPPPGPARAASRRRSPVVPALGALAVALAGYAVVTHEGDGGSGKTAVPPAYLVAPQAARSAGVCADSSGSAGDRGALARTALQTTRDAVKTWTSGQTIPTDGPVEPRPGLNLVVRVVEADSFGTKQSTAHTARVQIPGVSGLSAAEPVPSEVDYLAKVDRYDEDHRIATTQLTAARAASQRAVPDVDRLVHQTSKGSDVTGCVLALAEILGPDSNILVVSDLQDTKFTAANTDELVGRLRGVHLWIAQACPSAVPATCAAQRRAFVGRLRPLGLTEDAVTAVRPELVGDVVHQWLGR